MWKKLLVPFDGSPLAEHAVPYAAALARVLGARLTLLYAQSTGVLPEDAPLPDLDAVAGRLRAEGIDVDTHVSPLPSSQHAGDVILEAASDLNADLIVMATHGRGGLRRLIYGSTADRVLQRTTLPVLLIPPTCERQWTGSRPKRILVPLDGSEVAEAILTPLQDLVYTVGVELTLLRVAETIEVTLHGDECAKCRRARARGEEPDIEQVRAQRYIDSIADRLLALGIVAEARMEIGGASETISKIAHEQDIDLIAMATHGRSGLVRMVLGSVSTEILQHAHVPVLLVRPEAMRQFAPEATQAATVPGDATVPGERTAPARTRDIMSQPVVTVAEDATLEEIARLMLDRRVGGVPVVNAAGHIVGIVTESDFCGKACYAPLSAFKALPVVGTWMPKTGVEAVYQAARTVKARDVMSAPVITTIEDEPVSEPVRRMIEHDIRRLPVLRGAVPVGMVTRHDLLRLMEHAGVGR